MAEYVYIGLGSNLEQPAEQIRTAITALKQLPGCRYLGDSGLYLSKPLLLQEAGSETGLSQEKQADYYNAVALLETTLAPLALLDHLQAIEKNQGRVRRHRWDARTIDLDMLMYGALQMETARLQLPHPGLCQREFVLYPLQHLAEKLQLEDVNIPGHGRLSEIIKSCAENELKYVGEAQ
ncbi:MAG: 2-amino-4-hydroxy-6-hydroxymethyldihydropteridine diphosphokinase [Gammaproteobacteria bacterium]|nr:2-amino-4-hydroxy-6-hydroxymethyldihydropteridine diphosphokinase [Gammaproteobacteria bacterium]